MLRLIINTDTILPAPFLPKCVACITLSNPSLASVCLHPFTAFSSTGFDRLSSPVFCPLNPEGSIEDCLAALGDRVAKDLGSRLATAVHTLLSRSACVEPCGPGGTWQCS